MKNHHITLIVLLIVTSGHLAMAQLYAPEIKVEDTQGRVGIGVHNPADLLDVGGSVRIPINVNNNTSQTTYGLVSSFGDQTFSWDVDGTGSTYPSRFLKTYGMGFYHVKRPYYDGNCQCIKYVNNGVAAYLSSHFGIDFFTRNSLAMRIDWETRTVGINTANPAKQYKLHVNGNVLASKYDVSSDQKLKKNIKDYHLGLVAVKKIRPVQYEMLADQEADKRTSEELTKDITTTPSLNTPKYVGVLAQEIQEIVPDLVSHYLDENGEHTLAVDYVGLCMILVNAIQEQQLEIEALRKDIQSLKLKK